MLTKADIDWLKSEFLPDLAEAVEHRLKNKLDDIGTKLDKFVGDIKSKREEQILHQAQHDRIGAVSAGKRSFATENHFNRQKLLVNFILQPFSSFILPFL